MKRMIYQQLTNAKPIWSSWKRSLSCERRWKTLMDYLAYTAHWSLVVTNENPLMIKEKQWSLYVAKAGERFEACWKYVEMVVKTYAITSNTTQQNADGHEGLWKLASRSCTCGFPSLNSTAPGRLNCMALLYAKSKNLSRRLYARWIGKPLGRLASVVDCLNVSIDEQTFGYCPPQECISQFEKSTGYKWENVDDVLNKNYWVFQLQKSLFHMNYIYLIDWLKRTL